MFCNEVKLTNIIIKLIFTSRVVTSTATKMGPSFWDLPTLTMPRNGNIRINDLSYPKNELTYPKNYPTHPKNELIYPKNELTYPRNDLIYPKNDLTYPKNGPTHPINDPTYRREKLLLKYDHGHKFIIHQKKKHFRYFI